MIWGGWGCFLEEVEEEVNQVYYVTVLFPVYNFGRKHEDVITP